MIDLRTALTMQVATLIDELTRERQALAVRPDSEGVGPVVLKRLAARMSGLIIDLETLRDGLEKRETLDAACAELRHHRRDAARIFGESLATVAAPVLRRQGTCSEMFAVADRLLTTLSQAFLLGDTHFTIPADSDSFETTGQLIRLRYPATPIWDLPVAAHEFGHFFGPQWQRELELSPYEAFLQQPYPDKHFPIAEHQRAHRREQFADAIGVFSLGPAYAGMCILRTLNPVVPATPTHPSDADRALGVLCSLRELSAAARDECAKRLCWVAEALQDFWDHALADTRVAGPEPRRHDAIASSLHELWQKLLYEYGDAAYTSLHGAHTVSADFTRREAAADLAGHHAIRDILNGVWLLRLRGAYDDPSEAAGLERWGQALLLSAHS